MGSTLQALKEAGAEGWIRLPLIILGLVFAGVGYVASLWWGCFLDGWKRGR